MQYGQFCPIAKATEIIGEKWTILIIRELLMGGARFTELQRGLGQISPTILSKRLAMLEEQGLVYRRRISGQRGFEYLPTPCRREMQPILLALGGWGMKWARRNLTEADYDVGLLMLYLERSIAPAELPGSETVIKLHFTDVAEAADWWILVEGAQVDVCTADPGRDVDVYVTVAVQVMTELWMGRRSFRAARRAGELEAQGARALTSSMDAWLSKCVFVDLPSAEEILSPGRL